MGPLGFSQELAACLIKAGVFIRRQSGPHPSAESSAQRFWENSTEGDLKNTSVLPCLRFPLPPVLLLPKGEG